MTLPTLDVETIYRYAKYDAAREIFKTHYSTGILTCPTITDRAAEYGDIVIINYEGKRDGVPFSGGTAEKQEVAICYSSGYISGFAEGIVGHRVGETFDVTVTFPEFYPSSPDLAGQEVVFTMTLLTIYDVRLTEEQLTIYTQPHYETYDEWLETMTHSLMGSIALSEIKDKVTFSDDLPEETYLYFYQNAIDQIYYYAHYMDITASAYVQKYRGMSLAAYKEMVLEEAKAYALSYVVYYEVAKQNALSWTEEDYQTAFDSYVKKLTDRGYTTEFATDYVQTHQAKQIEAELIGKAVDAWLDEAMQNALNQQ